MWKSRRRNVGKKLRRGIQVGQGVHIQTESADVQQDDADAAQVIRFDFFDLAHEKTGQQVQEHQQHVAEGYAERGHGNSPHASIIASLFLYVQEGMAESVEIHCFHNI